MKTGFLRLWLVIPSLCIPVAPRPLCAAPVRGFQRVDSSFSVSSIAAAQDDDAIVFAIATNSGTGQTGAYRSGDAGETWALLSEPLPGETASTIAVDPRDSNHVLATAVRDVGGGNSSTRLYVSTDGGSAWRQGADFSGCAGDFVFDRVNPGAVFVGLGCSGGFVSSSDGGETWQLQTEVLLRSGSLHSGAGGSLYALLEDGSIIHSPDRGVHWISRPSPHCFPHSTDGVRALAVDQRGRLFASTVYLGSGFPRPVCFALFVSENDGYAWELVSYDPDLSEILFDPSNPLRVYGRSDVEITASEDDGLTWHSLVYPSDASQMTLSAAGTYLYAATPQGVLRISFFGAPTLPPRNPLVIAPR